jgi:hAT family protein
MLSPLLGEASKVTKSKPPPTFFAPRARRDIARQNYNSIQRREVVPTNPEKETGPSASASADGDTIVVDPHAPMDDDEDDAMPDVPTPTFENTPLTEKDKLEAMSKWKTHRAKHERKPRDKTSHVYFYMRKRLLPGCLYPEVKGGPHILQEYRWTCNVCELEPHKLQKKFGVLESHRGGVTSGMGDHLKSHGITRDTHNARTAGYVKTPHNKPDSTWSRTDDLLMARLTPKQSMRRWFVKSRQDFSEIESPEFQEIFFSLGTACPYRSRLTLRNHIFDDFVLRRLSLKQELDIDCTTISLTLDMWTAPNRKPIFAIIGHWITPSFDEREEVLEFVEVYGSHTGEALAIVVERLLTELKLKQKLFTITGDNASNNGTLCDALFRTLAKDFDDKQGPLGRPRMRFHGKESWIRCFAHVIALICGDVLSELKASTAKAAKKLLDDWDKEFADKNYVIPMDESRSSIAKIRLLNLWILRSPQREQDWKSMPKTISRRPIYDVDTRWNAMYDMIQQFLDLLPEYEAFVDTHPQTKYLKPTYDETLALHQIAFVLKPFKEMTLQVSENMPSVVRSLEKYWDLDHLLEQVATGSGIYSQLDQSLRHAFGTGRKKYIKYSRKLKKNALIYAAHILDPRCRASMIKDMMPEQFENVISTIMAYFYTEWPELAQKDTTLALSVTPEEPATRPFGMSLAQWKAIQNKKARDAEARVALPTSEFLRWIASAPLDWDERTNSDPEFVRKWWKEHQHEWPLLARAIRDLLPCSASEVDVERLFSGCKDEIGIRRHALKAETVRVLTLLRSAYTSEDKADNAILQSAMTLNVWLDRNSILWKPDDTPERLSEASG